MQHGAGGLDHSDGSDGLGDDDGAGPPWSWQHAAVNDAHVRLQPGSTTIPPRTTSDRTRGEKPDVVGRGVRSTRTCRTRQACCKETGHMR
jgi:hypothetical protein